MFLSVFGYGEVFFFQIANQISVFVAGDDVDQDEFGGYVHAVLRLLGWLLGVLSAEGRGSAG